MIARARRSWLRQTILALSALLLTVGGGRPAFAEKADHDKPTHIDYDSSEFDDLHQIYVFTGHVILTKGTILIRCDKLVVRRDPENYDYGTATMDAPGKLVYFHQKREGYPDQYIEGEGERLEYDEKADLAKIFVKAVVRRLDGGVIQDEIRGDMVQYNSTTEQYVVQSGPSAERAHALFAPAKTSNTPTGPNAPAASKGSPVPPTTTPSSQPSGSSSGSTSATPAKTDPTEPLKPSLQLQTKPDE